MFDHSMELLETAETALGRVLAQGIELDDSPQAIEAVQRIEALRHTPRPRDR
jgi:hypothetical protein